MSLKLYMDEQVQRAITKGLRARGIDVLTIQEDGREGLDDQAVLDRAGELGRVAFTRDDDFLREGTRRQRGGETFYGVIYAHQQLVSIGQCISDLELLASVCEPEEYKDHVEYLPLKK